MFLLLLQLISINGRLRIPHNGTIKTLHIAKWENSDPKRKKRPELADLFRFSYRYFLLFHVTFELIIEIFTGTGHDHNNYFIILILDPIGKFIIRLVIINIITKYARQITCFCSAQGVIN